MVQFIDMDKTFTEEEFQQFVVEQFGRISADVHKELEVVRSEITAVRVEIQSGFRELRSEVVEIKEIVEPLAKAFDNDAETIIEIGRRIGRLEEHAGMPKHA